MGLYRTSWIGSAELTLGVSLSHLPAISAHATATMLVTPSSLSRANDRAANRQERMMTQVPITPTRQDTGTQTVGWAARSHQAELLTSNPF
jgi:hypothetical protein